MTKKDYETIARVLARYHDSQARVSLHEAMAMVAVDLTSAFKQDNPRFDALRFWNAITGARKTEAAKWTA